MKVVFIPFLFLIFSTSIFSSCMKPGEDISARHAIYMTSYSKCDPEELLEFKNKVVLALKRIRGNIIDKGNGDPKNTVTYLNAMATIGSLKASLSMINAELEK